MTIANLNRLNCTAYLHYRLLSVELDRIISPIPKSARKKSKSAANGSEREINSCEKSPLCSLAEQPVKTAHRLARKVLKRRPAALARLTAVGEPAVRFTDPGSFRGRGWVRADAFSRTLNVSSNRANAGSPANRPASSEQLGGCERPNQPLVRAASPGPHL